MSTKKTQQTQALAMNRINAFDREDGLSVVICGSRSMPFRARPDDCLEEAQMAVAMSGFTVGEVICGCSDGADKAGAAVAQVKGLPLQTIEPEEDEDGRPLYLERNSELVRNADAVIAIWDGASNGTRDTIGKARSELGDEMVYVHPLGDVDVAVSDVEPREL